MLLQTNKSRAEVFARLDSAIPKFRTATSSPAAKDAQVAWVELAQVHMMRGDHDGAIDALGHAELHRSDDVSGFALLKAARLFEQLGDTEMATATLRHVANTVPTAGAKANLRLGDLLATRDPGAAEKALKQAVDLGDADESSRALISLGELRTRHDHTGGARNAYQAAMRKGHPEWAPAAAVALGNLEADEGNPAAAIEAYERAVRSSHEKWAFEAASAMGKKIDDTKFPAVARVYWAAIKIGGSQAGQLAFELGERLEAQGDFGAARRAFEQAVELGDSGLTLRAAVRAKMLPDPGAADKQDSVHHGPAEPPPERPTTPEPQTPRGEPNARRIFISHASEDKEAVARPLARALAALGWDVWLDEHELQIGDSLNRKLNEGLAAARFGVVVLSPAFFVKEWTKRELDGLVAMETTSGDQMLLPVWHNVSHNDVAKWNPTLADRLAGSTAGGIDALARNLSAAIAAHLDRSADKPEPARGPVLAGVPADPQPDSADRAGPAGGTPDLLDRLKALRPPQFKEVLFRLGVPEADLSQRASQTEQAIEVMRYVGEHRRSELVAVIDRVSNP